MRSGGAADDIAEVSVSVVRKGERKTVVDWGVPIQSYEREAPKALKQIEQQIDAAVANAQWVKTSGETRTPRFNPSYP